MTQLKSIQLNERLLELRWSEGGCGISGCSGPDCVCALCAQPIGLKEDDPRWQHHSEHCGGCDLCEDSVPTIIFRGDREHMRQAALHSRCLAKLTEPRGGV